MIEVTIKWRTVQEGTEFRQEATLGRLEAVIFFPDAEEPYYLAQVDYNDTPHYKANDLAAAQAWVQARVSEVIKAALAV